MIWKTIHNFDQFDAKDLYQVLKLRQEIFIIEQDCIYDDIDDIDPLSGHILMYDESVGEQQVLVAYCRIVPGGVKFKDPSIGRIAVNRDYRGKEYGKVLVRKALEWLKENQTGKVIIEAQDYLENFYSSFGFEKRSEPYDLDGISHILMELELNP